MKQRIFQRLLMTAAVAGLLTVGAHAARRSVPVQVDADTLPVRGYVDSGVTYVPLPGAAEWAGRRLARVVGQQRGTGRGGK